MKRLDLTDIDQITDDIFSDSDSNSSISCEDEDTKHKMPAVQKPFVGHKFKAQTGDVTPMTSTSIWAHEDLFSQAPRHEREDQTPKHITEELKMTCRKRSASWSFDPNFK